jgi:WD40 repeat protein
MVRWLFFMTVVTLCEAGTLAQEKQAPPELSQPVLLGSERYNWSAAFSPDGKMLAAGTAGADDVVLWDVANKKEIGRLSPMAKKGPGGNSLVVTAVAFSPDGKLLASNGKRKKVLYVWDLSTGQVVASFDAPTIGSGNDRGDISSVSFSPDGKLLAAGVSSGGSKVWDVTTGKEVATLGPDHKGISTFLKFSPDGNYVVSGQSNWVVRAWETKTWKEVWSKKEHTSSILGLDISPDSKTVATVTREGRNPKGIDYQGVLRLWDIGTGKVLASYSTENLTPPDPRTKFTMVPLSCVAFHPAGKSLVTGGERGRLIVWDLESGKAAVEPNRSATGLSPYAVVAFSPDGKRLVGVLDGKIHLHELSAAK